MGTKAEFEVFKDQVEEFLLGSDRVAVRDFPGKLSEQATRLKRALYALREEGRATLEGRAAGATWGATGTPGKAEAGEPRKRRRKARRAPAEAGETASAKWPSNAEVRATLLGYAERMGRRAKLVGDLLEDLG